MRVPVTIRQPKLNAGTVPRTRQRPNSPTRVPRARVWPSSAPSATPVVVGEMLVTTQSVNVQRGASGTLTAPYHESSVHRLGRTTAGGLLEGKLAARAHLVPVPSQQPRSNAGLPQT